MPKHEEKAFPDDAEVLLLVWLLKFDPSLLFDKHLCELRESLVTQFLLRGGGEQGIVRFELLQSNDLFWRYYWLLLGGGGDLVWRSVLGRFVSLVLLLMLLHS